MSGRVPDSLCEEIFIMAPPAKVFAALTEPGQLLQWWGDPAMYRCTAWTCDLRVGGAWRSEGVSARGGPFTVEGRYLEILPPSRLSFTWNASWTEPVELTVLITLESREAGTWLVWKMSGFRGLRKAYDDHRGGLPGVVGWLRAYVERGTFR
jgi:uncharacterized protein YndB with AHSA1/START domain